MGLFEESFARLNEAQAEAVTTIDGPLLVIAGPGTGKTQLLSVRAAHILRERDVQPSNILCLTYTDAGARAMRKRLIELVGRDAYGIEVSTFHSFASSVKSRYPEYFDTSDTACVISSLHAHEIIDGLLKERDYNDPLSSTGRDGTAVHLRGVQGFISNMKRQGLTPGEYKRMMEQTIAAADYLETTEVFSMLDAGMPRAKAAKFDYIARFEETAVNACVHAPAELWQPVVDTPGIYEPYIAWLHRVVVDTQLIDEDGKTAGFQDVRGRIAEKDDRKCYVSAARSASVKGIAAAEVYASYQRRLIDEDLFDFDDMVMDCIRAISENPELKYKLQERYRYIQVDEFQDTNGAQMRIVELLCEGIDSPNLMAVGDDDQAIMRFQGASIACIGQFRALYHPKSVVLKVNYRSTPEIVRLGADIADQIAFRLPESAQDKRIEAFRPSGSQTQFAETVFATSELQYQALAQDIAKRIDDGFIEQRADPETGELPDDAIAVMSPKHASLAALIPHLRAHNIPFSYKMSNELLKMEPLQTVFAQMRFAAAYAQGREQLAQSYIPQIIAAPELGGASESSVRFALFARREHSGKWMEALKAVEDGRLNRIYADLLAWSKDAFSTPVRVLVHSIARDSLAYYAARAKEDPLALAEFNAGMHTLLDFAETEARVARKRGVALRLPDLIERLDRAIFFNESINVSIELGRAGAVQLTSAHSSKGLEYDLVYLLDSDDAKWHRAASSSGLYPANMLIGDGKDDDDVRRLLFVAVTRAKGFLEIYRAGDSVVCELQGLVGSTEVAPDAASLASALEVSWERSYALDTPQLHSLLAANLPPRSISASALNAFVEYADGESGCATFPQKYIMKLPEAPQVFFDFGTIVHAYLERYVSHVIKRANEDPQDVAARYREQVQLMDFAHEDVAPYVKRFDRIAAAFGPWAQERLHGRLETEVKLSAIAGDEVPLFGYCDLLIVDDEAKTVRVVDYKTGKGYPEGEPDRAYQRQLQFYRLLIENSPDYAGYHVESCENWYVEPEKGTVDTMHAPVVSSVSDDDIAYLTTLIDAAWHRIAAGRFDTSAFEASLIKADALEELERSTGRVTKKQRATALQKAYERWLIAEDGAGER